MDRAELKRAVEAILFTLGDAVEARYMAKALDVSENEIHAAAKDLSEELSASGSALCVLRLEDSYQLCTSGDVYEYLLKIVSVPRENRLTDVQLETLSIIAYKQPVTKTEVENIRGVNSDSVINRLVELGLVEEKGRLDAPGRPFQFGTTTEFLRRFGLESTDDLPSADEQDFEAFKTEAEQEAGYIKEDIQEIEA